MFDFKGHSGEKGEECSVLLGLKPGLNIIFLVTKLFNTNGVIMKDTQLRNFNISQENVYDKVYFNKVTNLQCTH